MTGPAASAAVFLLLLAAGAAVEIRGRRAPGTATAARALAAALRTTPGRVTVFAAWLCLGVPFLAR
jgi:hypothetical protein